MTGWIAPQRLIDGFEGSTVRTALALCFCVAASTAAAQTPSLDNLTTEKTFDSWTVACGGQKLQAICVAASESGAEAARATMFHLANANRTNFVLAAEGAKTAIIRFQTGEKFSAQCDPLCKFASDELFQLFHFEPKVFADVQYNNGRAATFQWSTNGFSPAMADAKVKWMLRLAK